MARKPKISDVQQAYRKERRRIQRQIRRMEFHRYSQAYLNASRKLA